MHEGFAVRGVHGFLFLLRGNGARGEEFAVRVPNARVRKHNGRANLTLVVRQFDTNGGALFDDDLLHVRSQPHLAAVLFQTSEQRLGDFLRTTSGEFAHAQTIARPEHRGELSADGSARIDTAQQEAF